MRTGMHRRTAIAVASATVAIAMSGLAAAVAATGGHLLGFGTRSTLAAVQETRVVTATKYDDRRVLVDAPTALPEAPALDGAVSIGGAEADLRGIRTAEGPIWSRPPTQRL